MALKRIWGTIAAHFHSSLRIVCVNTLKCVWNPIVVSVSANVDKVSVSITSCVNASHCNSVTTKPLQSIRYAIVVPICTHVKEIGSSVVVDVDSGKGHRHMLWVYIKGVWNSIKTSVNARNRHTSTGAIALEALNTTVVDDVSAANSHSRGQRSRRR